MQRDHRRRRLGEELPHLLAGLGLEPERAVLELELEVVAEHVLDVVLATPFVGLAALDRLLGEAAVELGELRVRLPGAEADPSAGARRPGASSGGDVRVVGREDRARSSRATTSKLASSYGRYSTSPRSNRTVTPSSSARRRAFSSIGSAMSIAVTVAPVRAARIATSPVPVATSSTCSPARGASRFVSWSCTGAEARRDPLVAANAPDFAHPPPPPTESILPV